jgi:hypothetical protein
MGTNLTKYIPEKQAHWMAKNFTGFPGSGLVKQEKW